MKGIRFAAVGLLLEVLSPGGDARASIPSPQYSTVPSCLAACPNGDIPFTVVVRRFPAQPVGGATVVIDLTNVPGVVPCPSNGTESYSYDAATRTLRQTADPQGVATFLIRAGGASAGDVLVFADGVLLRHLPGVASPDQDGNHFVDFTDLALAQSKLATNDPAADFDCDLTVTQADEGFVAGHAGHGCVMGPTRAKPRSWGAVKQVYR